MEGEATLRIRSAAALMGCRVLLSRRVESSGGVRSWGAQCGSNVLYVGRDTTAAEIKSLMYKYGMSQAGQLRH